MLAPPSRVYTWFDVHLYVAYLLGLVIGAASGTPHMRWYIGLCIGLVLTTLQTLHRRKPETQRLRDAVAQVHFLEELLSAHDVDVAYESRRREADRLREANRKEP